MAGKKFYGPVGYGKSEEIPAGGGVWKQVMTEYNYYGDVQRNTRRLEDSDRVNPNVTVGNSISIVADPYARANFADMRYVKWNGTYWTIDSVEVLDGLRLLLRLGSVYNGPKASPTPAL